MLSVRVLFGGIEGVLFLGVTRYTPVESIAKRKIQFTIGGFSSSTGNLDHLQIGSRPSHREPLAFRPDLSILEAFLVNTAPLSMIIIRVVMVSRFAAFFHTFRQGRPIEVETPAFGSFISQMLPVPDDLPQNHQSKIFQPQDTYVTSIQLNCMSHINDLHLGRPLYSQFESPLHPKFSRLRARFFSYQ
ncbi:hypothetical protein FA15DRAFT_128952 [Coprinopsis marcescibilis]|uniref:Uncharacterized protein n=1 Tax=Coprinopsis marcescibilis TaxID=230819 RepID=A0A5C3KKD3_COPMA|nr:hypothetical protein FA15DRAFT_128952 [Coprinopsis marcescibilis]